MRSKMTSVARLACGTVLLAVFGMEAQAASVRFECDYWPEPAARSKIEISGAGLAAGNYSAQVFSNNGANVANSPAQAAVNGGVRFEFDSRRPEANEVETPIGPHFIVGLKA